VKFLNKQKQQGAAVLVIAVILVLLAVLLFIFSFSYVRMQQKTATNQYYNDQAFQAAEAGLEYGAAYLQTNAATVTGSATLGVINYTMTTVTMTNGSTYSVNFTNPVISDYTLLTITSTGTNKDGTSTRVLQQQFYLQSNNITYTAKVAGNVSFVGGSTMTNTNTNLNMDIGGTLTINNGASTYTSSGQSSTQGNIKSDVVQNDTSLSALTEPQFFQSLFGASEATVQATATAEGTYYNNAVAGGDYSQKLSGMTGKVIYINQSTVSLGQGVTIGSSADPVTIIVEGDLTVANGVTIYGFVYSSAPSAGFNLAGGAKIFGGMSSYGTMNISNGFQITFENIPSLQGGNSGSYAKVPGSWKDF